MYLPTTRELRRIVVLNPKGGAGKTTLAMNLAGYFAATNRPVALMDFDPQGSSTRWLEKRSSAQGKVYGIAAYEKKMGMTRSFQLRVPTGIQYLVIDTPAAMTTAQLAEFTPGAHAIILPVLPSAIDIHAASRVIADLLLVAKVSRRMGRLGVVANRVRENTLGFRKLMTFLDRLQIPIVGALRDSQNYVHAAEEGSSIHEMHAARTRKDLLSWLPFTSWLELRMHTPLTERDSLRPGDTLPVGEASAQILDFQEHATRRDQGKSGAGS